MRRAQPTTAGTWAKIGRQHYRHMDGAEVRYDSTRWAWRVTYADGLAGRLYGTLTVAEMTAERDDDRPDVDYRVGYERDPAKIEAMRVAFARLASDASPW